MKKLACLFCTVLILAGMICCTAAADTLAVNFSADTWFDQTVEEVGKYLEKSGYKKADQNDLFKDVVWQYTNASQAPNTVNVWFDSDDHIVDMVVCIFGKSPEMFEQLYQSLTMLYGEPEFVPEWEDKQERVTVTYAESYTWNAGKVKYYASSGNKSDGNVGSFSEVLKGNTDFTFRILQVEEEPSVPTATPTATPRPTATPKPVKVEVSIENVEIKDTRYGTREFYIRFRNNAAVAVDRIDFLVQGYNRYGELLVQNRIDTVSFYYDDVLAPGKLIPTNYYYTHYMLNEATKIRIAIQKYHTADGKTIEIPEYQLKWETFE